MSKLERDENREERIDMEAVVDAYGEEERAIGWYYYLAENMNFPFQAQWIRDFQEINYSIKIKSPHFNNNDNHYEGVRGGCRRQPPLTPSSIHEKLYNL